MKEASQVYTLVLSVWSRATHSSTVENKRCLFCSQPSDWNPSRTVRLRQKTGVVLPRCCCRCRCCCVFRVKKSPNESLHTGDEPSPVGEGVPGEVQVGEVSAAAPQQRPEQLSGKHTHTRRRLNKTTAGLTVLYNITRTWGQHRRWSTLTSLRCKQDK